jgi:hypothetical protein
MDVSLKGTLGSPEENLGKIKKRTMSINKYIHVLSVWGASITHLMRILSKLKLSKSS